MFNKPAAPSTARRKAQTRHLHHVNTVFTSTVSWVRKACHDCRRHTLVN